MITGPLRDFIDLMIDRGKMSDEDVALLQADICRNGISTRSEADALIALDRIVDVPASWGDFLLEAILCFIRQQTGTAGALPQDFFNWLNSSLDTGLPTERALRIAASVVAETHCVDDYLRRLAKMAFGNGEQLEARNAA